MTQPAQHSFTVGRDLCFRQGGAVYHYNGQTQRPRGLQLGCGSGPAGVFGNDKVDAVFAHQGNVARHIKRATRDNHTVTGQGNRLGRRVHQPENIVVLGLTGELVNMHPANRKKDAGGIAGQCIANALDIRNMQPVVPALCLPRGTLQQDQRQASGGAGLMGIAAHLCGKGMGGVDHMRDARLSQIVNQPRRTAKAPNPRFNRLCDRRISAACVRKNSLYIGGIEGVGQCAGLGRATQKKDAHGG